jgi:hypothetical protein
VAYSISSANNNVEINDIMWLTVLALFTIM